MHLNKLLLPLNHLSSTRLHLVPLDGYITQRNMGKISLYKDFSLRGHLTIPISILILMTLEHEVDFLDVYLDNVGNKLSMYHATPRQKLRGNNNKIAFNKLSGDLDIKTYNSLVVKSWLKTLGRKKQCFQPHHEASLATFLVP